MTKRPFSSFVAPESVEEASALLAERAGAARVLAGGTDLMVRLKRGVVPAEQTTLVSIHRIQKMREIRKVDGDLIIGAAVTATDLTRDPLVAEHVPILAEVADKLASAQIRNAATIGGNLANASPAGDLINPLLLLNARLELHSSRGSRSVAVEEFFTGPGATVMNSDEILTSIRVEIPPAERIFRFQKAGTRPSMECSVITVGIAWTPDGAGAARDVRVAFGSAAPTPLRGRETESVLEGASLTPNVIECAAAAAGKEVSPIRDVRGGAEYRRALVSEFVRRLIHAEG